MRIEFRPAPAGSGITFVRADYDPPRRIAADVANRVESPRRTTLSAGGGSVEMVEHVLAALAGLQVDNCEVWATAAEMPGCDGSSQPFVEAICAAGVVPQELLRARLVVSEAVRIGDDDCWIEAHPHDAAGLALNYQLDYGPGPIGRQSIELVMTPESFCRELAPARTFILEHEAQWLRDRGLGSRVGCGDLLVFDDQGPVDNELRFADECVRHKALDAVGDLALAGCDLVGRVTAHRTGHRHNAALVAALMQSAELAGELRRSA